jgi:hypothetical protein
MTLLQIPNQGSTAPAPYKLQVTYDEDAAHLGTTASTDLTIKKAATTLTLTGPAAPVQYGDWNVTARLSLVGDLPTGDQQTIFFVATGGSTPVGATSLTLADGKARLAGLKLPAGSYTLTAYFAGTIPTPPSGSISVPSARYEPATPQSISLTVQTQTTTVAYTGPAAIPLGSGLPLSAAVTDNQASSGDVSLATVRYTLRQGGSIVSCGGASCVFDVASGPSANWPALVPGLALGVYELETQVIAPPGAAFYTSAPVTNVIVVFSPTKAVAGAGKTPTDTTSIGVPANKSAQFAFGLGYLPQPTATAITGGTMSPTGTYTVGYSLVTPLGESGISAPALVNLTAAARRIQVAAITVPRGVSALRFYFTSVPAGGHGGFVVQKPVVNGQVAQFTIDAQGDNTFASSEPTGAFVFRVKDPATGATLATLVAGGVRGAYDWLAITGQPSNEAVFEGTGNFDGAVRKFRVKVTKAPGGDRFTIWVWNAAASPSSGGSLAHPLLYVSGTITPLPLDDDPSRSGIVFR